jgi:hypothetical protein
MAKPHMMARGPATLDRQRSPAIALGCSLLVNRIQEFEQRAVIQLRLRIPVSHDLVQHRASALRLHRWPPDRGGARRASPDWVQRVEEGSCTGPPPDFGGSVARSMPAASRSALRVTPDGQHLAMSAGNGQAAREILDRPAARSHLTPASAGELAGLIHRAGLGRSSIPQPLMADPTASVDAAETVLTLALGQRHRS